jgi:hypothetical protein
MSYRRDDESDPLFREEALDYFARRRGPGELLQVSVIWMNAAYWTFVVLVAVGLVATLLIRVDGEPLLYVLLPALHNLHG